MRTSERREWPKKIECGCAARSTVETPLEVPGVNSLTNHRTAVGQRRPTTLPAWSAQKCTECAGTDDLAAASDVPESAAQNDGPLKMAQMRRHGQVDAIG